MMPRKNKSQPFDPEVAAGQLIELGVRRRQFIKARIRVLNAAGGLLRRALGWSMDIEEAEREKIAKAAAQIMAADHPNKLPEALAPIATTLWAEIVVAREMATPGEVHQHNIELEMRRIARRFPVWEAWVKDVHGFSDLGLAIVISQAGLLDRYSTHSKLWRRLGLAPFTKDGVTRSGCSWRMNGGLSGDDWTTYGYSPRRRSTIYAQVGNSIIGGVGKGCRPVVGEDIEQNTKLSYYEKVFVHRLRYEAARDETMRRPETKEGKESYSKVCAAKAQYYTEKRLLKHLWQAWRRTSVVMAERPDGSLSVASISVASQEASGSPCQL